MNDSTVTNPLLLRTAMEVLLDAQEPLPVQEVLRQVSERIDLTPYWLERYKSGQARWDVGVRFFTGDAATVGWMTKRNGWAITEAGAAALESYPTAEGLHSELSRRYREVDQRRKHALESLSEVHQFVANTLELVEEGSWTAYDDIAELAGKPADEVAHFLANSKVKLPTAYRVLLADGRLPAEGMLNAAFRGTDLRARLIDEGVQFGPDGRASQAQRLTAEALRELHDARHASEADTVTSARRAWMVRGASVDGFNLVPAWLRDGFVSLSASQLGTIRLNPSYDELKSAVEAAYQHKSYAYRGQRLEELDRFIRRMQVGDLVLTSMHGGLYLGEVTSDAQSADDPVATLRRKATWHNPAQAIDASMLLAPVPALLQSQADVVDLTEAYDQLAALVPGQISGARKPEEAGMSAVARTAEKEQRALAFNPVTSAVAEDLLMAEDELRKIAELLWERKQVIFYGPPGTGKTYLAKALARHLTADGAVRLVQFHPSYTYEDFFEGFRPKQADSGTGALSFELTPGPFRLFAETAKANPTTAYILIIDEINRANLAKVFGELYFLLEYRDEAISLQYSPKEEFTLPPNLFIVGTMNTADRSIGRIDSAMRRRFAFIELDPRTPPVRGLLSRWLEKQGLSDESGLLLDALNDRLADADVAIGPSYLMRTSIYKLPDGSTRSDGLDRVWQYEIMPLLEDLFYGEAGLRDKYGLESLRHAIESP